MKLRRVSRKRNSIADGQISLIGDIHNLKLKYKPHMAISKTGEFVVVVRFPVEATEIERIQSLSEAKRMAQGSKTPLNRSYWNNKTRNEYRKKSLSEIVD